ncbi:MAG: 2'-5' RNA ligase family protein [Sphingobium sp.]|uniref:2'-5' RNA ligase family protein n=1 Tax=Sphingobium sp. TaxID=1912891 RepID=UPI0029B65BC1|nr:2'-5' RNA ligase family protein [Sphingobium sp.]MDX3908977.1 2'-5' RNA ligase family protein [Sphingobium sp.]
MAEGAPLQLMAHGQQAPIIVTALMGPADFAWADGLRRIHFPAERNWLPAHITLFHHLPPSGEPEILTRLKRLTSAPPPPAMLSDVTNLGRGVAYRVNSPALLLLRQELADAFHGMLTPQDSASPRLHVTIQNKAPVEQARALFHELRAEFQPRPLTISGLAAWWYRGGPWEEIRSYRFRG